MPDSSTKTISLPSRWAFFKGWPGAAFPASHDILIALDGALVGLLRAKAQRAQDAPDLRLAEFDAVQPLDNHTDALERPQLGTKSVFGWLLQDGAAQVFKLGLIESGRATPRWHRAQRVNSTFIEQCLPRVHGLPRDTHVECNFGWCLAFLQKSPSPNTLLRCLVHPFLDHA